MASCEKCWNDSVNIQSPTQTRYDAYLELLEERKESPCSKKEQAGQFWDDVLKLDIRA